MQPVPANPCSLLSRKGGSWLETDSGPKEARPAAAACLGPLVLPSREARSGSPGLERGGGREGDAFKREGYAFCCVRGRKGGATVPVVLLRSIQDIRMSSDRRGIGYAWEEGYATFSPGKGGMSKEGSLHSLPRGQNGYSLQKKGCPTTCSSGFDGIWASLDALQMSAPLVVL